MGEIIKDIKVGMPWYMHALLWLCFALLVGSFFVPPRGIIDGSVIAAVGEILGGAWLFYFTAHIPVYLDRGGKIRASHGDRSIEVSGHKSDTQE